MLDNGTAHLKIVIDNRGHHWKGINEANLQQKIILKNNIFLTFQNN